MSKRGDTKGSLGALGSSLSSEQRDGSGDSSLDAALERVVRAVAHAPPRAPPPDAESGSLWGERGRYVIERRLGRGGMGTVYLATDTVLGRQVALKVLDCGDNAEDDAQRVRMLREARLAAGLEHERVARVYDVGEHDGSTFVSMEYVRGVTLRAWMGETHAPSEAVAIVTQIAEGLSVLHASGVVHRDLKPENVMLQAQGGVKLLDFGLAGHVPHPPDATMAVGDGTLSTEHRASAFFGTPGYMAPEQYEGQRADTHADVFALGVMIAELVTGERPFKGTTMAALLRATEGPLVVLELPVWQRYPARLREIVARMLAREPAARFSNGSATLRALQSLEEHRSSTDLRRRWFSVAGIALAGVAAWLVGPRIAKELAQRRALVTPPPAGMVLIRGGTMSMGMTEGEVDAQCARIGPACDRERLGWSVPPRRVTVAPYHLDALETSNAEMVDMLNGIRASLVVAPDEDTHAPRYVRFNEGVGHDGEVLLDLYDSTTGIEYVTSADPRALTYHARAGRERWPVTQVTLFGARRFCAFRGKRLPTEDEWEAAARGTADRRYPWGNEPIRCGEVHVPPDGNAESEPGCAPTPMPGDVGASPQDVTPEGVHDLGGNVGEWVDTVFTVGSVPPPADVPDSQLPHVTRGGSFAISLAARTSVRSRQVPIGAGINGGFRCARSISSL
jgi:formylglycine-generating enzyme required for sulfatase activity/predicted Ser/Thr protein kinase